MLHVSLSLSLGESELLRKLEVSEFRRRVKRVSAEVPAVSGGSATSPGEGLRQARVPEPGLQLENQVCAGWALQGGCRRTPAFPDALALLLPQPKTWPALRGASAGYRHDHVGELGGRGSGGPRS